MIRSIVTIWIIWLAVAAAYAQKSAPVAFEVASIKPVSQEDTYRLPADFYTYPGGRIKATNCTVKMLVREAYDVEMYQVTGGPPWTGDERYDVEAKPPSSSPSSHWIPASFKTPPNEEMRRMLQSLLADRFQLKLHRESKDESVYALVVAKGGPKLKDPKDKSTPPFVGFGRNGPVTAPATSLYFFGQNATMDVVALRLAQLLRRPVSNHTGISGNFDF